MWYFALFKVRVNIWCISCQKRSVEALKERYYSVCNRLSRARDPNIEDSQLIAYDAPHECRRKMQLEKLLNRCVRVSVSVDKEQNNNILCWPWAIADCEEKGKIVLVHE